MPHLGIGIFQISEHDGPVGSFHTGRLFAHGEPLCAEVALLHHTFHAAGVLQVDLFDERLGITEVEAARSVGAGGHAETAADAAVHVHYHDPVAFALEGGLGRAGPHARRVFAVVAQYQVGAVLRLFTHIRVGVVGKAL